MADWNGRMVCLNGTMAEIGKVEAACAMVACVGVRSRTHYQVE